MSFFSLFGTNKTNHYECSSAVSLASSVNFNLFDKIKASCGNSFASSFNYNFNRLFSENINYVKKSCYSGVSYQQMYDSCLNSSYKTGCDTKEANKVISELTLKVSEIITTHWGNDSLIKESLKCVAPSEVLCNLITDYYTSLKSCKSSLLSCQSVSISVGVFSKSCFGSLIVCGSIDIDWYKANCQKKKIWCDGELDILIDKLKDKFDKSKCERSPLILDLDGDGVETLSMTGNSIYFDHDNNGYAEKTGWANKDDALLVIDKNKNGKIDNGTEMFGNNTSSSSENGFIALSQYDSNHDGLINSKDSEFKNIKLWQDKNSNGITDSGELNSLSDAGIKSISTGYIATNNVDSNGNTIKENGFFTRTNGSQGIVSDVWFNADDVRTKDITTVVTDNSILALPNFAGFGNVSDLHQAMQKDSSGALKSLVNKFISATNNAEKMKLVNDIIFKWTGVDTLNPNSLIASDGKNYIGDARIVYSLEKLLADDFKGYVCYTPNDISDIPNFKSAVTLKSAYGDVVSYVYGKLLSQTSSLSLIKEIDVTWNEKENACNVKIDKLKQKIICMYKENSQNAINKLYDLGAALSSMGKTGDKTINELKTWSASIHNENLSFCLKNITMNQVYGSESNDVITTNNFTNSIIYGYGGNDTIYGSVGDDIIYGGSGNDILSDRFGNDYLNGGSGNDAYAFNTLSGQDNIVDNAGNDLLLFNDSSSKQIWFQRKDDDLVVSLIGGTDTMTINDWYSSSSNHIENFKANDGKTLLDSQVANLVSAMASLTPPAAGQTSLSQSYQDQLAPVLAANWK